MSFLPFFNDKTLVAILKAVPLNRDIQEWILWRIIDGMMMDVVTNYMIEEELSESYDYYECYNLIDD